MSRGWIGVDLDGTLAIHGTGADAIGEPIPRMVERVKRGLKQGQEIRIFTARVANLESTDIELQRLACVNVLAIQSWCLQHLGQMLAVTCRKDFKMIELWDDRCIQVIPDTGERVDEHPR